MKRLITIFIFLIFIRCDNSKSKVPDIMKSNKFTWNIQLAGYKHNQSDKKGEIEYKQFIKEFENFPWLEQIEKANESPDGCSPTLSIEDQSNNKSLWVSMAGDKNENGYILGYIYLKEKKGFLGIAKSKTIRWLEMYTTENKEAVTSSFRYFFNRDYKSLESILEKLEDYGQMESKDLAN